jgi:Fe2+ transport system protein FeoA
MSAAWRNAIASLLVNTNNHVDIAPAYAYDNHYQTLPSQEDFMNTTALTTLQPGQRGLIVKIDVEGELRDRLAALGFRTGASVGVLYSALMGDPRTYFVCGSQISLRKNEANHIIVSQ